MPPSLTLSTQMEEQGQTSPEQAGQTQEQSPKRKAGRPKGSARSFPQTAMKRTTVTLTNELLQEMFVAYCKMPNLAHVSRTLNVHINTVCKFAREHEWETRRQKILLSARANADYTIQKATENSLRMLLSMKEKIREKIEALKSKDIDTRTVVADFEKLVKLEQILLGGTSDRQEHIITTHEERMRTLREQRMKIIGDS